MRLFSLGTTTLVQGLLTGMALVVFADVASPTFNIQGFPAWTGIQATVLAVISFTAALAIGVVMHTISRSLFHAVKGSWTVEVLTSPAVRGRISALGEIRTTRGGFTYPEVLEGNAFEQRLKALEFMHGIDSQLLSRAPHVYEAIHIYREQYRLARAFVVPSIIFALTLPFWAPMRILDGAGSIGPFPIIRTQLFLLSVLAASVSFLAFRERSYRYQAAKVLAWVTLEGNALEAR